MKTRRWLITSGGTKVRIDAVRHVGNMSSGRLGSNLARTVALAFGDDVFFLYAKGSHDPLHPTIDLTDPNTVGDQVTCLTNMNVAANLREYVHLFPYDDFDDYAKKLDELLKQMPFDIVVLAAAVSDYGMPSQAGKISSDQAELTFTMTKLPKLIQKVKQIQPNTFLVGFKLLVGATMAEMRTAVQKQMQAADSDMVATNDLTDIKAGRNGIYIYEKTTDVITLGSRATLAHCIRDAVSPPAQEPSK